MTTYSPDEVKHLLDLMLTRFNTPEFILTDPVQFPRSFKLKQDIEVSAILTAVITWGKRSIILKSAQKMHDIMGISPYDYIMQEGYKSLGTTNIHRTFFEDDMAYVARGLYSIYQQYESLESLFASVPPTEERVWTAISKFREFIIAANKDYPYKSLKHISNPKASSACKRLHLALKWLVRNDGIVDIGIWQNLSPSELRIPLDVHVGNVARKLGLLQRKQNDLKAVEELTGKLKTFNPVDPIIYDFALFGIGVTHS